jgi:Zn-dependent M16 (insulinase) family peptidase
MGFELNKSYSGFRLTQKKKIDELKSLGLLFVHEVTKAELMVLENDDDNK